MRSSTHRRTGSTAELRCGHHVEVLDDARRLVAAHPLRERLTAQMATCLDRIGRPIEALRVCRDLRARLSSELGVDAGDEIDRLERDLTARRRSIDRVPRHLPVALTRFVGRVHELAEITTPLRSDHRMLTLTGVGGVGKTRLALEAAATQTHHSVGVWLVELSIVARQRAVPGAVADVFGLATAGAPGPTTEVIAAWIGGRRLVVVLDNAEHVTAGAGRLAQQALLTACPNLSVLATSRMALHVPGEVVYAVPPMGVGGDDGPADAVTLFLERAAMARPATLLSRREQAAAAQVCRRLDGIPLAIELAAARFRMLSVDELFAARLDDVLSMLSAGGGGMPDRHRTIRAAALDWSHESPRTSGRRCADWPCSPVTSTSMRRSAWWPGSDRSKRPAPTGSPSSPISSIARGSSWPPAAHATACSSRCAGRRRRAACCSRRDVGGSPRPPRRLPLPMRFDLAVAVSAAAPAGVSDHVHLRVATEWSWEQGEAAAALELVTFQVESWMLPRDAEMLMWLERVLADPAAAAHPLRSRVLALLVLTLADCGEGASPRIEVLHREAAELADDSDDPVVRASVNLILVEWAISRQRFAEAAAPGRSRRWRCTDGPASSPA